MFYQSDLSSRGPQRQLAQKSGGGCCVIIATPILPENVCCVCTAQTAIPQQKGGVREKSEKPNDPSSKFHLLQTIQAPAILLPGMKQRISTQQN